MLIVLIYFLSFLFIRFISNVYPLNKHNIHFEILSCFLLLFFFFGFRDLTILTDTVHYYDMYRDFVEEYNGKKAWYSLEVSRIEPGFQIFQNILGKVISRDPYTIICFSSFIITFFFLYFIKHVTTKIALTTFIFIATGVLLSYYSVIRQSFAVLLAIASYCYFSKKKNIKAIILWILSVSFHYSALIVIVPFILVHIKWSKRNLFFISLIFLFLFFSIYSILNAIGLGDISYVTRNLERETTPYGQILNALQFSFLFYVYIYIKRKTGKEVCPNKLFEAFAITAIFVEFISIRFLIFARMDLYFVPFVIILFVRSLSLIKNTNNRSLFTNTFILLMIVRIVLVLSYKNEWYYLYPYSFFDFSDSYHDLDLDQYR